MKKFIFSLFILSCVTIQAQVTGRIGNGISQRVRLADTTEDSPYLLMQDFEGTGYDRSQTWTEGGAVNVDEDYTSTVLVESQSLNIVLTSSTGYTESPDVVVGAGRILYGYMRIRLNSLPASSMTVFEFRDVSNNEALRIRVSSTGTLGVRPGVGTEVTTVGTLAANTTYHIWFSASPRGVETALQSTARVSFSTDGVRPTSGNDYAIDTDAGGATDDISSLRLGTAVSSTTIDIIYDKIRIDNDIIGDNPL